MSTGDHGETSVDYGEPPAAIDASISALTCADDAVWGDTEPDTDLIGSKSAHVLP
jgi:hypothetical protein